MTVTSKEMIRAYHFVNATLRDGSPIPPDGEWLTFDGPVKMCKSGLHASRHPFDALTYAPGVTLCLVDVDDIVDEEEDKLVCRRRRIVARIDATLMLREFARSRALDVIHPWDAPTVVREYLETGNESLRAAARDAAWDARAAARDAAWAAARDATWAARAVAWDAAWAATWDAAWAAARDAARAAARDAAWAALDAAGDAAWAATWDTARDAAWDAAWAATWDAQKTMLLDAVESEFIAMGVMP